MGTRISGVPAPVPDSVAVLPLEPWVQQGAVKEAAGEELDHDLTPVVGANLKRLTSTGQCDSPAWSPDGTRLVYYRNHGLLQTPSFTDGQTVEIVDLLTGETRIGAGTKIDNLVQIGHNVVIGPNGLIISQVGLAGSTVVGGAAGVTSVTATGAAGKTLVGASDQAWEPIGSISARVARAITRSSRAVTTSTRTRAPAADTSASPVASSSCATPASSASRRCAPAEARRSRR